MAKSTKTGYTQAELAQKMLPYHKESREKAREMVAHTVIPLNRWRIITGYMTNAFAYDFIRAIQIPKKNGLPDVQGTWEKHMGICLDICSLTVGMLREVGIDAKLCIGKADGRSHAWVESDINGKMYRYDHDGTARKYQTTMKF